MVFYEAGECAGIKVDCPCIVTYREMDGEFTIKACEPTNKQEKITLEISRPLTPKSSDRRYTIECGEVTRITLDTSLSVGEAYEASFIY